MIVNQDFDIIIKLALLICGFRLFTCAISLILISIQQNLSIIKNRFYLKQSALRVSFGSKNHSTRTDLNICIYSIISTKVQFSLPIFPYYNVSIITSLNQRYVSFYYYLQP
jgi:hypothetical protein